MRRKGRGRPKGSRTGSKKAKQEMESCDRGT